MAKKVYVPMPSELTDARNILEDLPALMKKARGDETYRAVAAEAGIAHSAWYQYEHGRAEPTLSQIIKILDWMLG